MREVICQWSLRRHMEVLIGNNENRQTPPAAPGHAEDYLPVGYFFQDVPCQKRAEVHMWLLIAWHMPRSLAYQKRKFRAASTSVSQGQRPEGCLSVLLAELEEVDGLIVCPTSGDESAAIGAAYLAMGKYLLGKGFR